MITPYGSSARLERRRSDNASRGGVKNNGNVSGPKYRCGTHEKLRDYRKELPI